MGEVSGSGSPYKGAAVFNATEVICVVKATSNSRRVTGQKAKLGLEVADSVRQSVWDFGTQM